MRKAEEARKTVGRTEKCALGRGSSARKRRIRMGGFILFPPRGRGRSVERCLMPEILPPWLRVVGEAVDICEAVEM